MSFGLLSLTGLLLGIAALGIGLWLAQILRVRHREVEVLSTLFWQAATEESRARVFIQRFRHWWAWLLLVAIASLLWMLLATPRSTSPDGMRHVVLIDQSVASGVTRERDYNQAIAFAAKLPETHREIIAVGHGLQTLLQPNEPVKLAAFRNAKQFEIGPRNLGWAIETIAAQANADSPIAIYLVGDALIEQDQVDVLRPERETSFLTVERVSSHDRNNSNVSETIAPQVSTLGVTDAASGRWDRVDLWLALQSSQAIDPQSVSFRSGESPLAISVQPKTTGQLEVADIPANGQTIDVMLANEKIGSITMPNRRPIRIRIDETAPPVLRQIVEIDAACQVVAGEADVTIGSGTDDDLQLTTGDVPAFLINSPDESPTSALANLVDELAIRQIDATSIAQQAGRMIDVQFATSEKRRVAIWSNLFSTDYDFQESRACPLVVSRAVRWLANRPPLVEWVALGERLPAASPEFARVRGSTATTVDGRKLAVTRFGSTVSNPADLPDSSRAAISAVHPATWIGLLVAVLLVGEWILFQRGHMP